MESTAQRIRRLTHHHLTENNGLLFGQCISAVGWVAGTVPELTEDDGIVELPTSDSSNGGIVVGAGLAGRRPVYVVRYQGFLWYNLVSVVNYAAKSKSMWGQPCPIFVRAIGMEGAIGPVAGGIHHGLAVRMPGIKVVAPMTPGEWENCWAEFLSGDDPYVCSEHRLSYPIKEELGDIDNGSNLTIVAISAGRLNANQAIIDGLKANLVNLVNLKPLLFTDSQINIIQNTDVLVIDSEHEDCGVAQYVAQNLNQKYGVHTWILGLKDRTAGFHKSVDNLTPSSLEIRNYVKNNIYRY